MKKLVVLLLLMVVSTNVFAEWTKSGESKDAFFYVDYGDIKKKGNKVTMWRLFDYKAVKISKVDNNIKYLSSVTHYEYDCVEELCILETVKDYFRLTKIYTTTKTGLKLSIN